MLTTVRQAILCVELDERQVAALLTGVGPVAGLAAFGTVVGAVIGVIARDRRTLRSWLAPGEAVSG
jgi:hypothetical protein